MADIDICIQAVNVYRTVTSRDDTETELLEMVFRQTAHRLGSFAKWLGEQSTDFYEKIRDDGGKMLAEGLVRGAGAGILNAGIVSGVILLLAKLLHAL